VHRLKGHAEQLGHLALSFPQALSETSKFFFIHVKSPPTCCKNFENSLKRQPVGKIITNTLW
jgi:hypothetical protein